MTDGDLEVLLLTGLGAEAGDSVGEGENGMTVSRICVLEGKLGIDVGAPDRRLVGTGATGPLVGFDVVAVLALVDAPAVGVGIVDEEYETLKLKPSPELDPWP